MLVNLIEEAYLLHENEKKRSEVVEKWDNTGNNAMRASSSLEFIPHVGGFFGKLARLYGGYQAGNAMGHPVVGKLFGREAALGAASNHVNGIKLSDVYSKNNMINRGLVGLGMVGGILTAGESLYDNPVSLLDTSKGKALATIAVASPTITPAISYGLGKAFGSKKPEFAPISQKSKI